MSYGVTVGDIQARWRPLDASEATVAETLIGDAETFLDNFRPTLAPLVPAGVPQRIVTMLVANMVVRVLRNPDALTGQAVEDISQNFAGPAYDGRLYLTADELAMLDAAIEAAGGTPTESGAGQVLPYARQLAERRAQWACLGRRGNLL